MRRDLARDEAAQVSEPFVLGESFISLPELGPQGSILAASVVGEHPGDRSANVSSGVAIGLPVSLGAQTVPAGKTAQSGSPRCAA
jgi:hypothetical protein